MATEGLGGIHTLLGEVAEMAEVRIQHHLLLRGKLQRPAPRKGASLARGAQHATPRQPPGITTQEVHEHRLSHVVSVVACGKRAQVKDEDQGDSSFPGLKIH